MNNLGKFDVQELNLTETIEINGGRKIKTIKKVLEWIGFFDIVDDIREGFLAGNSGECPCK